MIAIDTNVVLRYLLQDDDKQSPKASKLFAGESDILITDVVLVETLWTLRGKRYGLAKTDLVNVIHGLIEEPRVVFEDSLTIWCALDDYTKSRSADFSDALIVNKALRYGTTVTTVYTFDNGALELDGTTSP